MNLCIKRPNNKLSEVIVDYAKPLTKHVDVKYKAISMSIICWNISLMEKEEARRTLIEVTSQEGNNTEELRRNFYTIFNMMYDRKQKYFKLDNRFIVDYSLSENDECFHLKIIAIKYKR